MVDPLRDQELTALFRKHLPHKPLPPDLADRLKQQVLAAVATTLQTSARADASRLPPEATPTFYFVAEQTDDQELYDLFQKHMLHRPLSPTLAVHLQQQVLSAADPTAHTAPTPRPTRHNPSHPRVQSREARWTTWLNRFRHLFMHPPALVLSGVASVLLVMFVLIGLSRTFKRPIPPPFKTLAPTVTAPSAAPHQAHLTITSGQAIIQKRSGQTETIAADTVSHPLAPGDRLITGESTARIEYFPGQSTTVEPGAEVELQEYAEEGATTRVALLVHSGKTSHEISTPLAEADLFEIRTPAAVASAKYTKLTVEVLSETQTYIETEAGTAEVLTADEEVVIAAGQQMTATLDNPWFMTPTSAPTPAIIASPWSVLTTPPSPAPMATPSATAILLMHLSEPFLPTNTAGPDEAELEIPPRPTPRETVTPAPTTTPTNTSVLPTTTATSVVPIYVVILVPTALSTPRPDTPTILPTSTTAIINTAESATDTPMPTMSTSVDTTTPTYTPVLPTRTLIQTATPTNILVPTATKTSAPTQASTPSATPTNILVPTATKTLVPPTQTPTPTNLLVPTSTRTLVPPTYTPTQTAAPTTVPVSPTASNTPVPSSTPTNTPALLPTATNTPAPPTAVDTVEPTATPTETPLPPPTATDTPEPTATPTDTPLPPPTATPTDTPLPPPTATDTPEPTATPTDTPLPPPTATATAEPLPTATNTLAPPPTATSTDTPLPPPTATATVEATATPTDTPLSS